MLGCEPVEEHAIGDFAGESAHLRPERRHDQPRRELRAKSFDPFAHPLQGLGVRTADAEQEAVERQSMALDAFGDALRPARVERDHADAELDAPGVARRMGECAEAVHRPGMVHPEGAVPEPFRFPRRCADDLGRDARVQCEAVSHRRLLTRIAVQRQPYHEAGAP